MLLNPQAILQRLRAWIRTGIDPHLLAHVSLTEADLARFRVLNVRSGRSSMRLLAALHIAFNLVFWPSDAFLLDRVPGAIVAMAEGRGMAIVFALLVLAASYVREQYLPAVGWFAATGTCAIVAFTVGRVGGPSSAWFHFLHPFMLMGLVVWQWPVQRLFSTSTMAVTSLVFYFVPNPHYLNDPMAGSASAHLAYIVLLSVLLGLHIDRIRSREFLLGLKLSRHAEDLEQQMATQLKQVESLGQSLEAAREEERAWLAGELHDEMGQVLTGMRCVVKVAKEHAQPRVRKDLDELATLLQHATTSVRDLLTRLRPQVLDELGLEAASRWLVLRTEQVGGIRCTLTVRDELALSTLRPEASTVAFRVLQEALTNAVRHSGAKTVQVSFQREGGGVELTVEDDGHGFDPTQDSRSSGSLGLSGMTARAASMGGLLDVHSTQGQGTRLRLLLPQEQGITEP